MDFVYFCDHKLVVSNCPHTDVSFLIELIKEEVFTMFRPRPGIYYTMLQLLLKICLKL